MSTKRLFILAVCGLILFGAGCFSVKEKKNIPIRITSQVVPVTTSQPGASDLPPLLDATTSQAVTLSKGEISSASKNVIVSSLVKNQALASPFVLLGRARVFENGVSWRVRDGLGNIIASGNTLTNAREAGTYGQYRVRAFLQKLPKTSTGKVEVYTISPRDGSEQDTVTVPVRLNTGASLVKVFFPNTVKDPEVKACDVTYPVTRRIPKTTELAEAAVLDLLEGPTAAEQMDGSRTAIVQGTSLRSFTKSGETVTVDFSREFTQGVSDVCFAKALRAQVEQTLRQFPGVNVVKISVEGADIAGMFDTSGAPTAAK
jgi:hypothetical protein